MMKHVLSMFAAVLLMTVSGHGCRAQGLSGYRSSSRCER